jgi:hypothetical protein
MVRAASFIVRLLSSFRRNGCDHHSPAASFGNWFLSRASAIDETAGGIMVDERKRYRLSRRLPLGAAVVGCNQAPSGIA